jgi:hypothetical protein
MVRRRTPGNALALSGAPSRTMRPRTLILRDAAKWPLLRMRGKHPLKHNNNQSAAINSSAKQKSYTA